MCVLMLLILKTAPKLLRFNLALLSHLLIHLFFFNLLRQGILAIFLPVTFLQELLHSFSSYLLS